MGDLRLAALILPLALDTFAVAAAIGVGRPGARVRLRVGLLFALFEGGMPLVGLLAGAAASRAAATVADYVAAAALAAVALHMLLGGEEREERAAGGLASARGLALVGLGLSVSMDELAMGFVIGLLRLPLLLAIILIAAQAFAVTQLGLAVGGRLAARWREAAERAAALVLLVLAATIVAWRLHGS